MRNEYERLKGLLASTNPLEQSYGLLLSHMHTIAEIMEKGTDSSRTVGFEAPKVEKPKKQKVEAKVVEEVAPPTVDPNVPLDEPEPAPQYEPEPEVPSCENAPGSQYSAEEVRIAFTKAAADKVKVKPILTELGVQKLSELSPSQYDLAMEKLQEAVNNG